MQVSYALHQHLMQGPFEPGRAYFLLFDKLSLPDVGRSTLNFAMPYAVLSYILQRIGGCIGRPVFLPYTKLRLACDGCEEPLMLFATICFLVL